MRLADRAGALAQVATVMGMHGGNILAIDVHRGDGTTAVDDLVVDFLGGPDWSDLQADLAAIASAELLERAPAHPADPVVNALVTAATMVAGDPETLAKAAAVLCAADQAYVSSADVAGLSAPIGRTGKSIVLTRYGDSFTATDQVRLDALVELYLRL